MTELVFALFIHVSCSKILLQALLKSVSHSSSSHLCLAGFIRPVRSCVSRGVPPPASDNAVGRTKHCDRLAKSDIVVLHLKVQVHSVGARYVECGVNIFSPWSARKPYEPRKHHACYELIRLANITISRTRRKHVWSEKSVPPRPACWLTQYQFESSLRCPNHVCASIRIRGALPSRTAARSSICINSLQAELREWAVP